MASLLLAAAAGMTGYVSGYIQGHTGGRGSTAPLDAANMVEALTDLRAERTPIAIAKLEAQLDTLLVSHAIYLDSPFQLAPLFAMPVADQRLQMVREYRVHHPSPVGNLPEVNALVQRSLGKGSD